MPAGSGAIRAGRAFIELFTEDSAVGRGLRAVSGQVVAWGSSVNKLGSTLGSAIGSTFSVISKGAKLAGFAVAGIGGALVAAAKLFSEADRSMLSESQAAAADRLKAAFGNLTSGAASLNAALMTSLAPGIEAIVDIVRIGFNAFQDWIGSHQELIGSVTSFLGAIRDALSAGEIELAAQVLWAGVQTAWAAGVAEVMAATVEWKTSLQQTVSEAWLGLGKAADDFWNGLADAGTAAADFISDAFQACVNGIAKAFAYVGEKIGLLEEGTAEILQQDQQKGAADRQASRAKRDQAIAKQRARDEELFGETVLEANRAIAEANTRAVEEAKADFERKRQELMGLQQQAKDVARPIAGARKAIDEKGTVGSAFAGNRAVDQLVADVAGKSIAQHTKDTAKNTAVIAEKVTNLQPGLAVI